MLISKDNPMSDLLAFIVRWDTYLDVSHRMKPEEIPSYMPPPLRQIYALTGHYPVLNHQQGRAPDWTSGYFTQDSLRPLDRIELEADSRFVFIDENQAVWHCMTRANHQDPPVYSDEDREGVYCEVCPRLSHFLVTFCLQELVLGTSGLSSVYHDGLNRNELIEGEWQPLWLEGRYVRKYPTHDFYISGDLLLMSIEHFYFVAYHDEDSTKALNQSLDWE